MASEKKQATTGMPEWTTKEEKRGLDPLGMQTTSVALYQELMPGISNVTLRMRYYGFYAWLSMRYAQDVKSTSLDDWCRYLRRAEALYALVAAHANDSSGIGGTNWAYRKLQSTASQRIAFADNADRGSEEQYLKQKYGAFGAAYGSQLSAIGILSSTDEHNVPVPAKGAGEAIARAYATAIGNVSDMFLAAATHGIVTLAELESMVRMLPSGISRDGQERQMYLDLLFSKTYPDSPDAQARSRSLKLVIRASQAAGAPVNANDIRWTLYSLRTVEGRPLEVMSPEEQTQRYYWAVYQANDLLQVAYGAMLKLVLEELQPHPMGIPLSQLVQTVVARLLEALQPTAPSNWQLFLESVALAKNARSLEDSNSELSLAEAMMDGRRPKTPGSDELAKSALQLLAVLHKRWGSNIERIKSERERTIKGAEVRSVVTELCFLDAHCLEPLSRLLSRLVKERVIERHLWVAMQKFRAAGDYTYLIEVDEGKVRLRRMDGPAFTNPRLASAIRFLDDLHLLGDNGPTLAGTQLLGAR